jgi:hypothetical protein
MISMYALKELGERFARKLLDALRILSGIKPSTAPELREIEEEAPSQTSIDEPDSPPTVKRRLPSNQRGRYGRH